MAVRSFGPSTLWAIPQGVPNPTPVKFGAVQSFTLDYKATTKSLKGQGVLPDAIGRSDLSITGKISFGWVHGRVFSDLFFGTTISSGQLTTANAEGLVVPAEAPYSVAVANGASYFSDCGVCYAKNQVPLQQVAAAPAVGQYMVDAATGKYTFSAADEGLAMIGSYLYTVAETGQQITISQTLQGIQPVFQIVNERVYQGSSGLQKVVYSLNACVANDLSTPTKQGDFAVQDMGFDAFCDDSGTAGQISINQVT